MAQILKADLDGLTTAAGIVSKGGVICYPTDTVYGLGCDPLNASAIKRTAEAKGERKKPMPVLVKGLVEAEKLAFMSEASRKLAREFWPGPLTMVLKARESLPEILAPNKKIGLRSPKHSICMNLLGLCSGALVGTSANLTGRPPATTAEQALIGFGDTVDLILDGGRTPLGVASTVIDLTQKWFTILREGPVSRSEMLRCLRRKKSR